MIEIHQAIFGQGRDQGHSLLRSSYSNDSIAAQFSGYTDLVDRPPTGILSNSIVRGFIIKNHFLLVKSFPDPTGRPGRVFSHAIIIKIEDYLKLKNVSDIRQFHLSEIDKAFVPQIIYYDNDPNTLIIEPTERMICATNMLVDHLENNNTIAWVDEREYWQWISIIWPKIPDQVKKSIKLGHAFNSKKLIDGNLNLIIISEEIKPNWTKGGYSIIDNRNLIDVNSDKTLQDYILGVNKANDDLELLLKELEPNITEIDDLRLFNQYAELYHNIKNKQPFSELLMLAYLVSKYNTVSTSSITGKNKIIDALSDAINTVTAEEFFSLQYQTWNGYEEKYTEVAIGNAMQNWLTENLFTADSHVIKAKIVIAAFGTPKKLFWHNKVMSFVTEMIKSWKPLYKKIIWEWFKVEPLIVKPVLELLPNIAQEDMTESIPVLEKRTSEIIMSTAQDKGWIRLLAMLIIKEFPSQKAFEKILSIAPNVDQSILEKMADTIKPEQLLLDASEISDDRLIRIAIKIIKAKPSLKLRPDIANLGWQNIWARSTQDGLDVWDGIRTPDSYLYKMMDSIVAGHRFNNALLKEMAESKNNSLKDYNKRSLVWSLLPANCKKQFLLGTLTECLIEVNVGNMALDQLEQPLLDSLKSPEIVNFIISTKDISIETKLDLLEWVKIFTEDQANILVDVNLFTEETSLRFGHLVQSKKWSQVAKHLFSLKDKRRDLEPAMQNCYQLLGILDRLKLIFLGYNAKIITQEEFWDTMYEKAIVLYPEGPNEHGLWERAGGNKADLHNHGSNKQIWQQAISHIKHGGSPTQKKLLEKMIEDYPFDDLLKQIKHII